MLMFLKAVGEAVVAKALKVASEFVPFGDKLYELGADVIDRYRKAKREDKIAADALAAVHAGMDQVRADAKQIAREVAAGQSEDIIDLVEAYLTQVPAAIQQSLKRPDDPTGTTLPFGYAVNSAEDVAKMLPPRVPRFRPNAPLPGRDGWVLERLLGVGGFGEVWFARNTEMPDDPEHAGAVKFCFGQTGRDLIHESDLILRVRQAGRHPHIVPLKDRLLKGDSPWLMFEYVAGGTLTDWIHALAGKPNEQRLPPVLAAIRQLAEAVAFFHRLPKPVVHRDLKPSNILHDRTADLLRITDFGIGAVTATETNRQESRGQGTRGGRLLSYLYGSHTPVYSSPQQRAGADPDPRDDIHALGVIAYQMLTGKLDKAPGTGAAGTLKRMGVSADVAELLLRCASEELDDRPKDAGELMAELASLAPLSPSGRGVGGEGESVRASGGRQPPIYLPADSGSSRQPLVKTPLDPPVSTALGQVVSSLLGPGQQLAAVLERLPANRQPAIPPARKPGEQQTILLPGRVPMTFAWCPPGTFLMGSPDLEKERGSDETQHYVTLTRGFWMSIHPVTQAQWRAVMGTDPSHFKGDTLPVEQVSWDDTQAFCAALKQKGGVELRLPTEAEWEYAARGGTTTPFYWGIELDGTQANCDGRHPYDTIKNGPYLEKTTPVGSYAKKFPHPWGLTDVIGNVWEWCLDWYDKNNNRRVLRGGSWAYGAKYCRAATRGWRYPSERLSRFGFRLCLDEPQG